MHGRFKAHENEKESRVCATQDARHEHLKGCGLWREGGPLAMRIEETVAGEGKAHRVD